MSYSTTGGWTCPSCGTTVPWNQGHACGVGQPFVAPAPAPQSGWRCPSCGAGNAPWKGRCDCVANINQATDLGRSDGEAP